MSNVLYPNKQEFDELIKNEKVLVDFFATWCGPCKMIGPNIEKLAEENADATVIRINVVNIQKLLRFKGFKQTRHL